MTLIGRKFQHRQLYRIISEGLILERFACLLRCFVDLLEFLLILVNRCVHFYVLDSCCARFLRLSHSCLSFLGASASWL